MKKVVFLVLILVASLTLSTLNMVGRFGGTVQAGTGGTGPAAEWIKYYGSYDTNENASSVAQTSDGGYILAGYIYGYNPNYPVWPQGYNALLVRTDSSGNKLWNYSYGVDGPSYDTFDVATAVVQAGDGGFVFAGYTDHNSGPYLDYDFWLVKTNSAGTQLWSKTYDRLAAHQSDKCFCMVKTSDGYALAGKSGSSGAWLLKTDLDGNEQWNKTFPGEIAYSIVHTSDGGYALAGAGFWKTDSAGNPVWNNATQQAASLIQTSDGDYALLGITAPNPGNKCFTLYKKDSNGNSVWTSVLDYSINGEAKSLVQTSDGGYALAGITYDLGTSPLNGDGYLIKTDSNGVQEWWNYYGGVPFTDSIECVIQTSDGGLALTGMVNHDMILVKLGALQYSATIWAWDALDPNGWIAEPITMDGSPTGYSTPHTFTGLTGTHTFTVPSFDILGYTFDRWSTGETSPTITVTSGGIHTAEYRPAVLAVRGVDNRIYYRLFIGGWWDSWNVVPAGATCDSPAAAILGDSLFMVVRGMDQSSLWYGSIELDSKAFSGWTLLSGATHSAPTLTSNGTALCLVVRGLDDRIYLCCYIGGGWGSWHVLSKGATLDGPAAALVGDNLRLFVRGMDGNSLWYVQVTCDGTFISDWTLNPGATDKKPTLGKVPTTGGTVLCLTVKGMDNQIYVQAGAPWVALPGATIDGPAATGSTGYKLHIFVRGMDGNTLWYGYYNTYYQSFSGWTLLDGATPSAPTLTS